MPTTGPRSAKRLHPPRRRTPPRPRQPSRTTRCGDAAQRYPQSLCGKPSRPQFHPSKGPRPSIRILRPADPIMRDQTAAIFRRPVDLDERRRFYDPASRPAGGRSRRPKITIIGPRNRPALR
jgi:hypothetical protein